MISHVLLIVRSSRMVLWPAILLNAGVVTYGITASLIHTTLIALSLCFVASFGFLLNDYHDIKVDRINNSGRLEGATPIDLILVLFSSSGFFLFSLILSILMGTRGFIGISVISLGLIIYTFYTRRKLIFATILSAVLSSAPLWLPSVVFSAWPKLSQIGIILISITLLMAREIIFDARDIVGDSLGKRRTFATVYNIQFALNLSVALNIIGSLLLLITFIVSKLWQTPSPSWIALLTIIILLCLIIPEALNLRKGVITSNHFKAFTQKSRMAMLLLPVIWLML